MIDNNLEHNKKSSKPRKVIQRPVKPKLILSLLVDYRTYSKDLFGIPLEHNSRVE
jgi:hypothetical protein